METTAFLDLTLSNWESQVKRMTMTFDSFSDEELFLQVAPHRNRVIYILGHVTAVHDMLLPLLGLGARQHPELDAWFITHPDDPQTELPAPAKLRACWKDVNALVLQQFRTLPPSAWLQKHTMVTQEEFEKEPHRNRFNVLLSRLTHMSYHLGQLVLVNR